MEKMYSQFCVREDSLASVIPKNNLISHANSISARDDAFTIRNERSHERERDAFSQRQNPKKVCASIY